jgi:hypothetical protein
MVGRQEEMPLSLRGPTQPGANERTGLEIKRLRDLLLRNPIQALLNGGGVFTPEIILPKSQIGIG